MSSPHDAYFAALPASTQATLERVRSTLRKALPDAEEVISYKIPAFRLHGRVVLFFAGWKSHFSLYPAPDDLREALGDALTPYLASRGTLRFELKDKPPLALIAKVARFHAAKAAERIASKVRTPKPDRTKTSAAKKASAGKQTLVAKAKGAATKRPASHAAVAKPASAVRKAAASSKKAR